MWYASSPHAQPSTSGPMTTVGAHASACICESTPPMPYMRPTTHFMKYETRSITKVRAAPMVALRTEPTASCTSVRSKVLSRKRGRSDTASPPRRIKSIKKASFCAVVCCPREKEMSSRKIISHGLPPPSKRNWPELCTNSTRRL